MVKLFVAAIFTASNQFSIDEKQCEIEETCNCGETVSFWYILWVASNAVMFILAWMTECSLLGGNPSRKQAKRRHRNHILIFNPFLIIYMFLGLYFIMNMNNDDLQTKKCLKSNSFTMQKEISIITFFLCALEIIHLVKEFSSYFKAIKQKLGSFCCSFLHRQQEGEAAEVAVVSSCDEDEQRYERAWHHRNQLAEERRVRQNNSLDAVSRRRLAAQSISSHIGRQVNQISS